MSGDSFEMEDHRNWTDASFKTYVRPLALPCHTQRRSRHRRAAFADRRRRQIVLSDMHAVGANQRVGADA